MIQNLSQLKRAIASGCAFEIVEHGVKPEMAGQIRRANVIQTNGIYSHVVDGCSDEMRNTVNAWNGGRGSWAEYGKASDWSFTDGLCKQTFRGRYIWTIRVIQ